MGANSWISGGHCFARFRSKLASGLVIGSHCTMDGVHFAVGESASIQIGNYCYFTNALLLCELNIRIGDYVMIGWNATIADTDFHPIAPAERIVDAIACSPLGDAYHRPKIKKLAVTIDDNVYIGPNAVIFKGVNIGQGAFIEAGTVITSDVPPSVRIMGNPAEIIERL